MDGTNQYARLKRSVYLVLFPVLFVVNSSYWLFSPHLDRFLSVSLPFICLYLLICTYFFYVGFLFRFWELFSLALYGCYHLFRIYAVSNDVIHDTINVYLMWSPLFFVYVFLVLERRTALVFSTVIYIISVVICIPSFQYSNAGNTIVQYYITTIMYIVLLYFLQSLLSSYIESDMLRKFAFEDPLTKTGNRRMIDSMIEQQIANSIQNSSTFSVIYLDIDHFKVINDQYGHDIGDQVLREFADKIKSHTETTGYFFGRWGGEEFIVIVPDMTSSAAADVAEQLRHAISQSTFSCVGKITASFGVTDFRVHDVPKTLLARTDQALYLAKDRGRNRVVVS